MAEEKSELDETPDAPRDRVDRGWRDLWQAPTLLFGAFLLVVGILSTFGNRPHNDYDGALDDAQALIQNERFDEALELLNHTITPAIDKAEGAGAEIPAGVQARVHLLRADAIYLADAESGSSSPDNSQHVVDEYEQAERLLVTLSPKRVGRLASALVSLGREDDAIERVRTLPASSAQVRRGLLRRVIDRALATPGGKNDRALDLLAEFRAEPGLSDADRVWTILTQARLRLDAGYVDEAIDHLLVALQRNADLPADQAARLYTLLGDADERAGRLDEAEANLQRAQARLSPSDPLMGEVHLIAGRVAQGRGDLASARDQYAQVVADYRGSDRWAPALLGLAEMQGMLGESTQAFESFGALVARVHEHGETPGATRKDIASSLLDQVGGALAREDFAGAIRYAKIAQDLYVGQRLPAAVSLALARSERLLADRTLAQTRRTPTDPPDVARLDPVSRMEVRSLYLDAGEHFLTHARTMIVADDDAFAESLWNAGECFDLAGADDRAIEVFAEYASGRPDDPRRPAAVFRLAQAHQALGELDTAESFYRELIAENPTSGEGTRSDVWLARALLQDDDSDNDAEAESLFKRVIDGSLLEPDALEFRAALVDLGRFYYRRGEYAEAIRRLDEAVRRYPDDPEAPILKYELADAHRLRADELEHDLGGAMPEADRRGLVAQRRRHLVEAGQLFEQVRATLQPRDPRRLSAVETSYLRNAYFYRADAAFDLGDFDRAIGLYDTAAQRYAGEPISLVAMAQIVGAFIAQGRFPEARKANERARQRLAEFPDDAFTSSDLPFTRKHWERWLDSTDALSRGDRAPDARTASAQNDPQ